MLKRNRQGHRTDRVRTSLSVPPLNSVDRPSSNCVTLSALPVHSAKLTTVEIALRPAHAKRDCVTHPAARIRGAVAACL
jgi:hypothetical protein